MAAKQVIDWELMESDWVAGIKSVSQLSSEYGVSRQAIVKHWDKENVSRSLEEKIKAAAAAMVTEAMVTGKVAGNRTVTDKDVISVNAKMQADKIIEHRNDIKKARTIAKSHFAELETALDLDLKERVTIGKMLTDTLKTQIGLEREAFCISDNANGNADASKSIMLIERVIVNESKDLQ